jgi:RNA polymerase sigma-70 factor (ECF subfamily)
VEPRSDAELVTASRDGDRGAFGTLVGRHSRRVFALCMLILGDPDESEDAMQEVFLSGLTRLGNLDEPERFAGWINQVARNHCRDLLRKRKRRRLLLRQRENAGETGPDFADIHVALGALPEHHRLPLMLFYFDGQSTRSVAEALKISQAAACTRLSRARGELRRLLEGRREQR